MKPINVEIKKSLKFIRRFSKSSALTKQLLSKHFFKSNSAQICKKSYPLDSAFKNPKSTLEP